MKTALLLSLMLPLCALAGALDRPNAGLQPSVPGGYPAGVRLIGTVSQKLPDGVFAYLDGNAKQRYPKQRVFITGPGAAKLFAGQKFSVMTAEAGTHQEASGGEVVGVVRKFVAP